MNLLSAALAFYTVGIASLFAQPVPSILKPDRAAPPTPPPVWVAPTSFPAESRVKAAVPLYSIGEPSPEEQEYVELINRARANPSAEAQIFFTTTDPLVLRDYENWEVDLDLMVTQFAAFGPRPPLAINSPLTVAARRHTKDMFDNVFQEHTGTDGSSFVNRAQDAGYVFSRIAENIFSYAGSVFHGHAGFEVDWGPGVGGMQTPAGHRANIHGDFREIGVGVILGRNEAPGHKAVGPQLVTQEFGTSQQNSPLITGVAFYDLNGNGTYEAGEGIGQVGVRAPGASAEALTSLSGGYAIPVPGNGTYTVTFSGGGFTPFSQAVTVEGSENEKIDFKPAYSPPVVSGSASPLVGRLNNYSISVIPGARAYQWRAFHKVPAQSEGAETGTNRLSITQTGTYEVIQGVTRKSGQFAFQLAHPETAPQSQLINLLPIYLINNASSLTFESRLGWAAPDQIALVQVSSDEGANWSTSTSQPGSNGRGETSFSAKTVSLSAFAGQAVHVRFVYEFSSGSFFGSTEPSVGWFIDDIVLSNVQEIANEQIADATGVSFQFQPATIGDFVLQARGKTGHEFLNWGFDFPVRSEGSSGVPEVRLASIQAVGGNLQLDFDLIAGSAAGFSLESSALVSGGWSAETAAFETVSPTKFRFIIPLRAEDFARFYRVLAN